MSTETQMATKIFRIGIDIGGTRVRIGLFGDENLVRYNDFPVTQDYSQTIERVTQNVHQFAQILSDRHISSLGVGIPGFVQEGVISAATNLPSWNGQNIESDLQIATRLPVLAANDCEAAAIGEALFNPWTRDFLVFVYLTWGTGVGGARVQKVDRRLLVSPFDPGHQILVENGLQCVCGQLGCAEAYLGGAANESRGQSLADLQENTSQWEMLVERATHLLINTYMNHVVKLIILGGGVIAQRPTLLQEIQQQLNKVLMVDEKPRVDVSIKHEYAGMYGAMGLFLADLI